MFVQLLAAAATVALSPNECPTGLFKATTSGEQVVIVARPGQPYRYTFLDGRRGDVGGAGSPFSCSDGRIAGSEGSAWSPIEVRSTETSFESHGAKLGATLLEPTGPGPHPLVVFVHGSERTSPLAGSYPLILVAQGISVFAYDKRGTARSEGEYTQNFELLADDAAAALAEARRMATSRFNRTGYFGGSQGGWIAPLAATRSNPDFVAIGFGLIGSPIEEDREQVLTEMRGWGYGEPDITEAREVAAATAALVRSNFTSGFEHLADVRHRYGAKPWFNRIEGEFTGAVLREKEADLRRVGAAIFDNLELIWDYDSRPVIPKVKAPQLWILAEADRQAPPATTLSALQQLRDKGAELLIYSYPETDHGMVEFTQAPDGTRTYTRVTDGYFRLLGDWIKGRLDGSYGHARKR